MKKSPQRELEETVRRQNAARLRKEAEESTRLMSDRLKAFMTEKAIQRGMTLEAYVEEFRIVDPEYTKELKRQLGL